jgi:WD40 repeat protein
MKINKIVATMLFAIFVFVTADLSAAVQAEIDEEVVPGPFCGHWDPILSLAFSPDERILVSTSDDTIRIWDVKTGKSLRKLDFNKRLLHFPCIKSMVISPDNKLLVILCNRAIAVYDIESDEILFSTRKTYVSDNYIRLVKFIKHGSASSLKNWVFDKTSNLFNKIIGCEYEPEFFWQRCYSCDTDVWDLLFYTPKPRVDWDYFAMQRWALSPNANFVVVKNSSHFLEMHCTQTGKRVFQCGNCQAHLLACSSNGRFIATVESRGLSKIIKIRRINSLREKITLRTYELGKREKAKAIAVNSNGSIAIGLKNGDIKFIYSSADRILALAQGMHPRLGDGLPVQLLPNNCLQNIYGMIDEQ